MAVDFDPIYNFYHGFSSGSGFGQSETKHSFKNDLNS